jgi:Protein of unknown function (DUF3570)
VSIDHAIKRQEWLPQPFPFSPFAHQPPPAIFIVITRKPYFLAPLLCSGIPAAADIAAQRYDYSYQLYREDDDRIQVESHYIRGEVEINADTAFRFQWLSDAISGASPTGVMPGNAQPFLSDVEDTRIGILGALSRQFGDHRVELELSRSEEDDYTSNGIALSDTLELNQKNTIVAYGFNYLDDSVTVPGQNDQAKQSYDLFAGVTQIIDKNTLLTANLTVGYANGYLNDPYKVVQRDEIVFVPGPLPVVKIYPENRPDNRLREVLQLEGRRYFEAANGALDCVLRFSHDDYGVLSETAQIEWRQEIGEHCQLIPFFRYHHQSAADFFMTSINGLPIGTPSLTPDGSGPNYSADYRLSSLDAISLGLRLRYQITDSFTATACYERYAMSGSGSDSSSSQSYPDADIWTFGVSAQF